MRRAVEKSWVHCQFRLKQARAAAATIKNFRQSASKIAVSANGQAAAIGQPDKAIKIYDAQSGRELRELSFKANPQTENSSLL